MRFLKHMPCMGEACAGAFLQGRNAAGSKRKLFFRDFSSSGMGRRKQTERFLMEAGRMREAGERLSRAVFCRLMLPSEPETARFSAQAGFFALLKPFVQTCRLDFSACLGEDEL